MSCLSIDLPASLEFTPGLTLCPNFAFSSWGIQGWNCSASQAFWPLSTARFRRDRWLLKPCYYTIIFLQVKEKLMGLKWAQFGVIMLNLVILRTGQKGDFFFYYVAICALWGAWITDNCCFLATYCSIFLFFSLTVTNSRFHAPLHTFCSVVLMKECEKNVRKSYGVKAAEMRSRDIFDFTAGRLERLTSARDLHLLSHFFFAWKFRSKRCHCCSVHKQTRNTHTHKKKPLASSFHLHTHSLTHSRPLPSSSALLPEAQRYFYLP